MYSFNNSDNDENVIAITQPLELIDHMFNQYNNSNDTTIISNNNNNNSIDISIGEHQYYENLLQNNDIDFYSNIPVLKKKSLGKIKQNTLVKYRGIVHDIYDIEFFCALFEERSLATNETRMVLSKYRDVIPSTSSIGKSEGLVDFDLEGPKSKTVERLSILLNPIPGESDWSINYFNSDNSNNDNNNNNNNDSENQYNNNKVDRKRSNNDDNDDISIQRKKMLTNNTNSIEMINNDDNQQKSNQSNMLSSHHNHHHHHHHNDKISCLAKFYESATIEKGFKLNDMIEIIGIFSLESYDDDLLNSQPNGQGTENLFFGDCSEFSSNLPPCSMAPRIHCITYRRLGSSFPLFIEIHNNNNNNHHHHHHSSNIMTNDESLVKYAITSKNGGPFKNYISNINNDDKIRNARDKVITMLEKVFDGDRLVAIYVMLAILSRIHGRHENLVLGSLPLNIIGFQVDDKRIDLLKETLSLIVPRCTVIQADIDSFNNNIFLPYKDYDTNIMHDSPLQLASGTVAIINETSMKEGLLTKQGIDSIKALQSIVSKQILPVVFGNYEVKLPTDYSFIFISNISSSLITSVSSDIIKIKAQIVNDINVMDTDTIFESDEVLDDIRLWWSNCRLGDVKMDENMVKYAEDDFVLARQTKDISPSTFHTWLTIARLITISFGVENMEPKHWDMMRDLEKQRNITIES